MHNVSKFRATKPEIEDADAHVCGGQVTPRNDVKCNDVKSTYTFALAAGCARVVHEPLAQGGRGERRMPAAPAASCALCIGKKHTSKRVHRNHPAFPHAMVLTVSFELSPVTGLFATVVHG